ncbi:D-alanine--D-alanine ligase [Tatumella ptyseos]|uniref:D-alanine--D-alanine ligase n=2 Tax=Tatumella ptyseos TaxID=82987 RepID=A0A085JK85_9GAMM|nr:D-alanine--D-alanine ligase [Tatumella ptyseos]KFD20881.1 D-alanine--D-alanine ligase [Tatumella ptyseos ATCC 33301]SQK76825.1 D-alanine--D-alanine ligase A [Tatumella ptyseos]
MTKQRVGIIFGGKSAEHEVSLQSAKNIIDAIDKTKFEVVLLGINKQGYWQLNEQSDFLLHAHDPQHIALNRSAREVALVPGKEQQQLVERNALAPVPQVDVIFPIVHGTLGEDGSLQGLLRMANLPFVGSGVLGSAVSMDKEVTKRLLRDAGLQVAPFITAYRNRQEAIDPAAVIAELGLPLFVKPANQGSSVGVSKVHHAGELLPALQEAFRYDRKVLIETGIVGREIECAVLGNDQPEASHCGEIVLSDEFYSYQTKYINEKGAQVVVPAEITPEADTRIREIALQAFQALECCGMARVDVFLTPDDQVIINEINTLPGFTNISMYPKLWQASGLGYSELITRLIELAFDRYEQDKQMTSAFDH